MQELFPYMYWPLWFVAGFVTGLTSIGGAMVAVPVLVLFMPPALVVPIACLAGLAQTASLSLLNYKDCLYGTTARLLIATAPGAVAGVALLMYVSAAHIQLVAGLVMLLFVIMQYVREKQQLVIRPEKTWLTQSVGFGAGMLTGAISFGGPPIGAYALYLGWTPKQCLGTLSVYSTLLLIIVCLAHGLAGMYSSEVLDLSLIAAVCSAAGVFCAAPLTKKLPVHAFKRLLLLVIGAGGIVCMVRGLEL